MFTNRANLYKIGRAFWSPEVYPSFLRIPDFGFVRCIIPDLLDVAHEFDQIAFGVPEVLKMIFSWAMATWTIEQYIAIVHEVISLAGKVREVLQLEGEMMHLDSTSFGKRQAMMIRIAAHPEEDIIYPVGDAEAQYLAIELSTAFAIIHK